MWPTLFSKDPKDEHQPNLTLYLSGRVYRDGRVRARLRLHLYRSPGRRGRQDGVAEVFGRHLRGSDDHGRRKDGR